MTEKQIRTEIKNLFNGVPDNVLNALLDFLKELNDQSANKVRLTKNLLKILNEDKELLKRLAK